MGVERRLDSGEQMCQLFRNMRGQGLWRVGFGLLALAAVSCGGHATQQNHELRLLDSLGLPAAHTQALVDGKLVTTDEDGRAELGELPARYDAVVVVATNVFAFAGLEARSPTLELDNVYLGNGDQHGASVTISKASTPAEKQLFFAVGVAGGEIARQSMGHNSDEESSWGSVTWVGEGDVTLSAQAFQADLDPESGSVVGYSGYASQTWPNAGRQSSVDWTPEFGPPTFGTKTIHVELAIPADVSVGWYSVYLVRSSGENGPIATVHAGPSADILVPDLPGASFDIYAVLGGPAGTSQVALRGVSAGATVHAEGGDGLRQLAPEDASENVTPETEFG